jgi:formamidopyrimidine-DNA glycosylase
MPELPEITVYVEALERTLVGKTLERVRLASPFLLRTYDPPLIAVHGRIVRSVRRLGKRLVFELDDDLFIVIHLMIAGRFKWKQPRGIRLSTRHAITHRGRDEEARLHARAAWP